MVREERQIFRPTMIRSKVLLLVMTNFLITSTSKIEPVFPRFRRMDAPSKEKSVCDKKDPNAYRDPCCDFPASKVFDGNFMTPKERECVKSKCPGDQHPKTKGVYFASVFNKKSGKYDAFKFLKEKEIINARRLSENPITLEKLSKKYKISRERIRQIETKAFEKLQKAMLNSSNSKNLLPAK